MLQLYRQILRALRDVPADADRRYLKDWARAEFRRNKDATEEVRSRSLQPCPPAHGSHQRAILYLLAWVWFAGVAFRLVRRRLLLFALKAPLCEEVIRHFSVLSPLLAAVTLLSFPDNNLELKS